ncbi:MAG: hypothetical protein ACRCWY_10350 [Cellulosilyticaceae bacterium]
MGKWMSVLEKYNIIEKQEEARNQADTDQVDEGEAETIAEEIKPIKIEEVRDVEEVTEEKRTEDGLAVEEEKNLEEKGNVVMYDRRFSLEEIYHLKGLKMEPQTETVFVLENLIQALPAELPEYVKKQTVDNIIVASAMNLEKLLADGEARQVCLKHFTEEYSTQTIKDIEALTAEIAKLSAIIKEYQEQIKNKESMLQEQSNLMKKEEQHLAHILEFFAQK